MPVLSAGRVYVWSGRGEGGSAASTIKACAGVACTQRPSKSATDHLLCSGSSGHMHPARKAEHKKNAQRAGNTHTRCTTPRAAARARTRERAGQSLHSCPRACVVVVQPARHTTRLSPPTRPPAVDNHPRTRSSHTPRAFSAAPRCALFPPHAHPRCTPGLTLSPGAPAPVFRAASSAWCPPARGSCQSSQRQRTAHGKRPA